MPKLMHLNVLLVMNTDDDLDTCHDYVRARLAGDEAITQVGESVMVEAKGGIWATAGRKAAQQLKPLRLTRPPEGTSQIVVPAAPTAAGPRPLAGIPFEVNTPPPVPPLRIAQPADAPATNG